MNKIETKNYGDSYLYSRGDYGKILFEYIVKSRRIDNTDPSFDNIRYMVKRSQITTSLCTVLDSKSVVLMLPDVPIMRTFKVFAGRDVTDDNKLKVFIDCAGLINYGKTGYDMVTKNVDILITYLSCAMATMIYYVKPEAFLSNTNLLNYGTDCFANLAANIIDYMRIGGVDNIRETTLYMAATYFQRHIWGLDDSTGVDNRSSKISTLSRRQADVINIRVDPNSYDSINTFIDALAATLNVDTFKLDNFIDKWIFLYGGATPFATELFSAFTNMMLCTYCGAYTVNQKTIEKIIGSKMVAYCKEIFKVGGGLL